MKTTHTNIYGIKTGDVIEFVNRVNHNVKIVVSRISEKSCYSNNNARRESWGTVNGYVEEFRATVNGISADDLADKYEAKRDEIRESRGIYVPAQYID